MDANGARRTAWLPEGNLRSYDGAYVQSTTCHPMQHLSALLIEMGFKAALMRRVARTAGKVIGDAIERARPRQRETVFEPGMTFHFMPGLWASTWGLK